MPNHFSSIFIQRNSLILILLGFASGLPIALTSSTLQAWMTVENVDLKTIGIFSLVGQAYVFKFLWAPLMDRYTPSFLGRRRGWLLISQLLLIVAIIAMGFMEPAKHLWWLAAIAVIIAFCSASQDIVFDAYRADLLSAEERGIGAATTILGYRVAMLVSGGLALWLADRYLGWQSTYWLMAGLMLIGVIATLIAPEPDTSAVTPTTLEQAIMAPLRDFFSRNDAWLILLLIVLYKLGDVFAASMSTPFLIRELGFNAGEVGLVNKTLGLMATIIGALYGGILMQRLSLYRALMVFGILQAVSNLGYWVLAITDKNIYSMGSVIFLENLCGGMGTAAFVALLMTLCNKSFSATQFALLSAIAAVGRVYVGPMAGWFIETYNWSLFYLFAFVTGLPGLLLLYICRQTLKDTQQMAARTAFKNAYCWVLRLLTIGCMLLAIGIIVLITNALDFTLMPRIANMLLLSGAQLSLGAILLGGLLDYLVLKREKST